MARLSDPIVASELNPELQRLDLLEKRILKIEQKLNITAQSQQDTEDTTDKAYFNTVLFTWTGGTLTLSWSSGYVKNKQGKVFPVTAGSKVVSASTGYWTAWNVKHYKMVIESDLTKIKVNKYNYVLGSIRTGTGIQTGDAGGGGSDDGGTGDQSGRYSKF